ncbi:MAG: putative zinc-binding metallopeptidase [Candidatus Gracilibacteria bacterium]|nr:putative zinc-binding metallopeptidase [Candidatus Gracilibacteria bacterium]
MKKLYLFIITLTIFSFGIYIIKNYFLGNYENDLNNYIENKYIEPVEDIEDLNSGDESVKNKISEKNITKKINEIEKKIIFYYFPDSFNSDILNYTNGLKSFFHSYLIIDKIDLLKVEMHQDKSKVRGNMKERKIRLFGVKQMSIPETVSVGIHEFGHFIDLYYFKKQVFTDISYYFYNISWDGVKVIKSGHTYDDFVSGYAMTNKYEDFAESFIYYILHNNDFQERAKKSIILKSKYDFFSKYLFRNKEFDKTNFGDGKIKPYYRDTTKINFSLQNFLEFLKK